MTGAARGWSDHASGDKVSEAIIWCVERRELGNRATPIRHDHFFAGLYAIDVLAETILKVADPDLGPRSGYLHAISVATSTRLSRASQARLLGERVGSDVVALHLIGARVRVDNSSGEVVLRARSNSVIATLRPAAGQTSRFVVDGPGLDGATYELLR